MPDVYTETAHEAVDLLAYFQKGNGAEEPNEDVAGHRLAAYRVYLRLYLALGQRKGRRRAKTAQKAYDQSGGK